MFVGTVHWRTEYFSQHFSDISKTSGLIYALLRHTKYALTGTYCFHLSFLTLVGNVRFVIITHLLETTMTYLLNVMKR